MTEPIPFESLISSAANVGDKTDRSCGGGCGKSILAPGPVWCRECLARVEGASIERAAETMLRPALASIPNEWRDVFLYGSFLRTRVRSTAMIVAAQEGSPWASGAVIRGALALGKTSLACAMFREWVTNSVVDTGTKASSRFVSARMVPRMPDRFDQLAGAAMIVLDDVGSEGDMPHARAAVADLISERHAWSRPTIVTTWLDAKSVAARYGDGIARRMFERSLVIDMGDR